MIYLLIISAISSLAFSQSVHNRRLHAQRSVKQPPRVALIKLADGIDRTKPITSLNPAGIAFTGDLVIGEGEHGTVVAKQVVGDLVWRYPTNQTFTAPIKVIGNDLYVAVRSGEIFKLRTNDGTLVWKTKLANYADRPLLAVSGLLIVATISQHLYALDTETGKIKWFYDSESEQKIVLQGGAPPIAVDRLVYYGDATGNLTALALTSGAQRFRYHSNKPQRAPFNDIVGQLAIFADDQLVFATASGQCGLLQTSSSPTRLRWQRKFSPIATTVRHGERYYLGLASGEVLSLALADGRIVWHKTLGWPVSKLAVANNHLYVASNHGFAAKLRLRSGSRVWQEDLGATISAPLTVFRGMIFFSTALHNSYGYRL